MTFNVTTTFFVTVRPQKSQFVTSLKTSQKVSKSPIRPKQSRKSQKASNVSKSPKMNVISRSSTESLFSLVLKDFFRLWSVIFESLPKLFEGFGWLRHVFIVGILKLIWSEPVIKVDKIRWFAKNHNSLTTRGLTMLILVHTSNNQNIELLVFFLKSNDAWTWSTLV